MVKNITVLKLFQSVLRINYNIKKNHQFFKQYKYCNMPYFFFLFKLSLRTLQLGTQLYQLIIIVTCLKCVILKN